MADMADFMGQEPHPGNIPTIYPDGVNRTMYHYIIKGKWVETV